MTTCRQPLYCGMSVGDVGTVIRADLEIDAADMATATEAGIKYRTPSGDTGTWQGTVSGTTAQYVLGVGDLAESGEWVMQGYVVMPTGTWHGAPWRELVAEVLA